MEKAIVKRVIADYPNAIRDLVPSGHPAACDQCMAVFRKYHVIRAFENPVFRGYMQVFQAPAVPERGLFEFSHP